jgi:Domain of unknown function (DUF4070)
MMSVTPFPGTPLHARLRREGRLPTERYRDRCTLFDVPYTPKLMSVAELEAGLRWPFAVTYTRRDTEARLQSFVAQRRDGSPRTARCQRSLGRLRSDHTEEAPCDSESAR